MCPCEWLDYFLFDLILLVDKVVVPKAFECTLLDQLFTRALSDTKSMAAYLKAWILLHKINNLLSVEHSAISQEEDVSFSAVFRCPKIEDRF